MGGKCARILKSCATPISLQAGDALLFHPWLPHRTQLGPGLRMAWYARFVEQDARFRGWSFWNILDLTIGGGGAWCNHMLQPGEHAHHVCIQQVYPMEQNEFRERMAPDWQTRLRDPAVE